MTFHRVRIVCPDVTPDTLVDCLADDGRVMGEDVAVRRIEQHGVAEDRHNECRCSYESDD